jgi:hypothetical protein
MPKLCFLVAIVLALSGCERRTQVELADDASLVFSVSGSGRLSQLTIYGPEEEDVADPESSSLAVWRIVPVAGDGERLGKLRSIRYGIVPSGYKQIVPSNDANPVPLLAYKRYFYRLVTMNAPSASGYFEIRDGKPIKVAGPCFELRDDKWVRIDCSDTTN